MWGYSINFPDDDSHNEVPITISNGKFGQQATVTMGQLSLNQGSLAAPSFTGDFTPPAEIEQQVNKVSYFQQLFDREGEQLQVEQASALQTAGINVNMTFNEVLFKGPSWGKVAAIVGCWAIGGAISVIATKGLRFVTGPAGGAVGAFCNIVVDKLWRDPSPPNPANMTPMPSNPSVPVDLGNNMSDPGGGTTVCVPPPGSDSGEIILPPLGGGTENTVVPFEETTTVCL